MSKRILITGVSGQDGAYLAQSCLAAGDEVWGVVRPGRNLSQTPLALMGLVDQLKLVENPLATVTDMASLLDETAPDDIYNLAAQSSVAQSFTAPDETFRANAQLPFALLEALRTSGATARLVQASTCEVFGQSAVPCDEATPLTPASPYGVTKAFAQQMVGVYRATYGLAASCGILFLHESPYRPPTFLTRKVTSSLANIRHGRQDVLELGNLSAERDWGFAGDYVEGLRLIAAANTADDYVLATGETHSVRDFVSIAANCFGYDLVWRGVGAEEFGANRATGQVLVRVNPQFFRPIDAPRLLGIPKKAERNLRWRRTVNLEQLIGMMTEADEARVLAGASI